MRTMIVLIIVAMMVISTMWTVGQMDYVEIQFGKHDTTVVPCTTDMDCQTKNPQFGVY